MTSILSLDQGTTSSRAIVFDQRGQVAEVAQQEYPQHYPAPGHVEHDPEDIWRTQLATAQQVMRSSAGGSNVAALGITNQRETVVLWEKSSGTPVANAIVWQSRITAPRCEQLKSQGHSEVIREKTGLVVDAYFSGSKIEHLLNTVPGLRQRAERGEILAGTIDTFLAWRLTGGRVHVTDVSNASRTMLFNLHTLDWDDELLRLFHIPREVLPRICSTSEVVGETDAELLGRSLPIAALVGDQQAATFGQACFEPGDAKNTYGTGCFMLLNLGQTPRISSHGLLTTVGWRIGKETVYCIEGSVFIAGAAVQWLRDGLGIIKTSSDVGPLASSVSSTEGVYFVPAFVGLGTPHWDPTARGTIVGITRGTTAAHLARATLEATAFQSLDVLRTMQLDGGVQLRRLKVDGGASVSDALLQFQCDLLDVPVLRPRVKETTALGAACLAGLAVGVWKNLDDIRALWQLDREFHPTMPEPQREKLSRGWARAVERARGWAVDE